MSTIKVPSFSAYKNVIPGFNRKIMLRIEGWVYVSMCEQPYLAPLKGPTPLFFEVKFKDTTKPGTVCSKLMLPRSITPYHQKITGAEKTVSIKVPGLKRPITVPIKSVS